jgi:hypothetical protein
MSVVEGWASSDEGGAQMSQGDANDQIPLSFLGMANIAVRLVREKYQDAELYEGDGISPGGPTTKVQDVNSWRFVFRAGGGGTAIIKSTVWGEFGPIQYIAEPWLEDRVIPWPIEMDITQADNLLKQAGYTGPYSSVTLRWPLYPGMNQPFYIFQMENEGFVFVGVYDGSVNRESAA